MFAYNPTVQDRSGEIIASAANNASEIYAQGMQNFGQSIGSAMQSIGEGIQKRREDAAKLQTSMSAGEAMMNLSQQFGPEGEQFRQSFTDSLTKAGNNPDKIAGTVAAHTTYFDDMLSRRRESARMDNYKDLADYKASLGGPGTSTTPAAPKLDAQYGREFYMGLRNNGRSHEQALQDMRNAGLNWAINDIERPQNQGFFGMPNPAATSTGP